MYYSTGLLRNILRFLRGIVSWYSCTGYTFIHLSVAYVPCTLWSRSRFARKFIIGAVGASMKSVNVDVKTDFMVGFLKFANWTSNGSVVRDIAIE